MLKGCSPSSDHNRMNDHSCQRLNSWTTTRETLLLFQKRFGRQALFLLLVLRRSDFPDLLEQQSAEASRQAIDGEASEVLLMTAPTHTPAPMTQLSFSILTREVKPPLLLSVPARQPIVDEVLPSMRCCHASTFAPSEASGCNF